MFADTDEVGGPDANMERLGGSGLIVLAMVGESAPLSDISCWGKAGLPRCEKVCLSADLVGVAIEGNGNDERELEPAPWSPLSRLVLCDRPYAVAGELIPLSSSCSESDNSSSV